MVRRLGNLMLTFGFSAAVVVLLVASPSLAEIGEVTPIDTFSSRPAHCQSRSPAPAAPAAETDQTDCGFDQDSPLDAEFIDVLPVVALSYSSAPAPVTPPRVVRELPAGPGGATLFLMGVGCIGAVKLGRSVRGLHLQSLPDWYHAGGPMQIGHVSAINPDLTAPATFSICDLLTEQSIQLLLRRAVPLRLRSQWTPALATSRAPPHLCL